MNTKLISLKYEELFFFIAWSIHLVSYIFLKQSEFNSIYDTSKIYIYINLITIYFLILKFIFFTKYSIKEMIIYGIVIIVLIMNMFKIGQEYYLFMGIVIISAKEINFRKFILMDIFLRSIILFIIIGLCLVNILPNYTSIINGSYKQSLGFYHQNTFAIFSITIIMEILYIKFNKFKITHYIMIIFALFLLNYISPARASIYSILAILIISLIFRIKPQILKGRRLIRKILIFLPIIITAISIFLANIFTYTNIYLAKLDNILTTRLKYANIFFEKYGLSLFGENIDTVSSRKALISGQQTSILDMGFLRVGINNGLIILFIVCISIIIIQKYAIDNNDNALLLCSIFFIILGFAETYTFIIEFNFVWICLPNIILENKRNSTLGNKKT